MKTYFNYLLIIAGFILFAGCAKENLPTDRYELDYYKGLYMPIVSATNIIQNTLYQGTKSDTTFYTNKVTLGGAVLADKDISITYKVLPQDSVNAFNTRNATSYVLIPADAYAIEPSATIKTGFNNTGPVSYTVYRNKLSTSLKYILPVTFESQDPSVPINEQKKTVYYTFWVTGDPIGRRIGVIPQLADPRTSLFEFYDDLMLRDTIGDLWVYPLGSNGGETIGTPYKVGSGFPSNTHPVLFFHNYYGRLIYWSAPNYDFKSRDISTPPNVIVGAEVRGEPNSSVATNTALNAYDKIGLQLNAPYGGRIFPWPSGAFGGIYNTPGGPLGYNFNIYYAGLDLNPSIPENKYRKLRWTSDNAYANSTSFGLYAGLPVMSDIVADKCATVIDTVMITMRNVALWNWKPTLPFTKFIYRLEFPAGANGSSGGPEFWQTFLRMFSTNNFNDLIFYRANGDVVRYKNWDLSVMHSVNYIK